MLGNLKNKNLMNLLETNIMGEASVGGGHLTPKVNSVNYIDILNINQLQAKYYFAS